MLSANLAVFDEAMVWAATWNLRTFCYCGEMSVRFRRPARIGEKLHMEAKVELSRPKLVGTAPKGIGPIHQDPAPEVIGRP